MPAQTAKGFPYPLGTDRLMDGDDAIKALADFCNSVVGLHAANNVNVPVAAGAAVGSVAVTFPVNRFALTGGPIVTATYVGTNVSWSLINLSNITTSGMTVGVSHRDGTNSGTSTNFLVHWHAVSAL